MLIHENIINVLKGWKNRSVRISTDSNRKCISQSISFREIMKIRVFGLFFLLELFSY